LKLSIIKYNAGNIRSVLYALERIGLEATVTDDHEILKTSDKVIFPGVGEASTAMKYLKARGLDRLIAELEQPFLGICLGMQLMCRWSAENNTECIGIFEEKVMHFDQNVPAGANQQFKIPQIGWNNIYDLSSPIFEDIEDNSYCYFVHGYYAALGEHTIATANYIQPYSAGLQKNNFFGVQFHPEKSSTAGEKMIKNFVAL